ncbi:MAG: desulfoferrodoxin [Candidatus Moranbacteria bacterium]|nr:desulfoferrodoxin [Candidatus Moranbacteria bacterium]
MTTRGQIYKCEICGNIVEVLHEGQGELVCCGQPMLLQLEKTEEVGLTEKHLPVIEKTEKGILVKIGSVPHPMEEAHSIEWIKVERKDGRICRKHLSPKDKPEMEFNVSPEEVVAVYEYCNLHRLWVTRV